jgi:hypothetical protein
MSIDTIVDGKTKHEFETQEGGRVIYNGNAIFNGSSVYLYFKVREYFDQKRFSVRDLENRLDKENSALVNKRSEIYVLLSSLLMDGLVKKDKSGNYEINDFFSDPKELSDYVFSTRHFNMRGGLARKNLGSSNLRALQKKFISDMKEQIDGTEEYDMYVSKFKTINTIYFLAKKYFGKKEFSDYSFRCKVNMDGHAPHGIHSGKTRNTWNILLECGVIEREGENIKIVKSINHPSKLDKIIYDMRRKRKRNIWKHLK